MTATRALILLTLVAGASACARARGFDRGKLSTDLSQAALVTDEDIRKALELHPQLPKRFRLGVLFRQPGPHWSSGWTWQPEDKDAILQAGEKLKESDVVSQVTYVSTAIAGSDELKAIRYAAAQHGMDAVLIVSGVAAADRYNNLLGPLYALLVTPFFVPGTVIDSLFVAHAALWDVRNGFLYASSEVDARSSQTRPAFFAREADAIAVAKADAIKGLAEDVDQRVRNLATPSNSALERTHE
jgi:hypothetical protein